MAIDLILGEKVFEKNVHVQAFEESESLQSSISQMFWLALELNDDQVQQNSELFDLLSDMSLPQLHEVFGLPPVKPIENNALEFLDDEQLLELLISNKKFGFFAQVARETCRDFKFKNDGTVQAYSPSRGIKVIFFVYAESAEELLTKIDAESVRLYNQWEAQARKEQGYA